jgi:hypothetical protein
MTIQIQRREVIYALGGITAAWPLASHAPQSERMRRIGVLMLCPENDPQGKLRATALQQGLQQLGWVVGRNVQIDFQWGFGDADWIRSAGEDNMCHSLHNLEHHHFRRTGDVLAITCWAWPTLPHAETNAGGEARWLE